MMDLARNPKQIGNLIRRARKRLGWSQTQLGEVLGITSVHVNRTLQQLRSDDVIAFDRGRLMILDWSQLKSAGEFDPGYLQLRSREREGSRQRENA